MIPESPKDRPNHAKRKWVEKVLSHITYVNWDRFFYNCYGERDELTVFGWIDREQDAYKDFAALFFDFKKWEWEVAAISSQKYSNKIVEKWAQDKKISDPMHIPCQRVEDMFKMENCIKNKEV